MLRAPLLVSMFLVENHEKYRDGRSENKKINEIEKILFSLERELSKWSLTKLIFTQRLIRTASHRTSQVQTWKHTQTDTHTHTKALLFLLL